jgi:hypothetical protein
VALIVEAPYENLIDLRERAKREVSKVVIGQDRAVELLLVAALARGHVLIEGPPGSAKTLLGRADVRLRLGTRGLLGPAGGRSLLGAPLRLGRRRRLRGLLLAERLLEPLLLGLPEEGRKRPLAHARPLTAFHSGPPPQADGSWKQPCRQGRT